MSKKTVLLMIIISCLALVVNVQAFESKDSGEFVGKLEMDTDPTDQSIYYWSLDATKSFIDGVMDFNTVNGSGDNIGYWQDKYTEVGGWADANFSTGFTYEIRIHVVKANNKGFGAWLNTTNGFASLFIDQSSLYSDYANFPSATATGDNTDGFHIFRLVCEGDGGNTYIYKDNTLILTQAVMDNWGSMELQFGDGNAGSFNSHSYIDYIRWTPGTYGPPVAAHTPTPADTTIDVPTNTNPSWLPGFKTDATNGHDVYFGTDFADVNAATTASAEFMGNQSGLSFNISTYNPDGFTRLTNYYWRVDEVNATDPNVWKGKTWTFKTNNIDPFQAQAPNPDDGTIDVTTNRTLTWQPGVRTATVNGHDVYIGTSYSDVNDATTASAQYMGPQSSTSFPVTDYSAGGLRMETDYYWRVDEVNGASTWAGNVWGFTTRGRRIPSSALSATASSYEAGQVPGSAIDGSGLNVETSMEHDNTSAYMWITKDVDSYPGGTNPGTVTGPAWLRVEFDAVYNLGEMWAWGYNENVATGKIAETESMKNVTIEYSTTGGSNTSEWDTLGNFKLKAGTGRTGYRHNAEVDFQGMAAKYVVITANDVNGSWKIFLTPTNRYGLSEVAFFESADYALIVEPEDEANDLSIFDTILEWTSGDKAAATNGQDVYLGTSFGDVEAATTASSEYQGRQTDTTFDPGVLKYDTEFFWRIDAFDGASTYVSNVWSFTTEVSTGGADAYDFDPGDNASYFNTDDVTELTWMPGSSANEHDVYFGTDFTDVNNATTATATIYKGRQSTLSFTGIGTLDYADYFWRIDEVDGGGAILKGATIKFFITHADNIMDSSAITGTASHSDLVLGRVPADLLGPGLSAGLLHDTNAYAMWCSDASSGDGYTFPNPGTVGGHAWLRFDLGQVFALGNLRVWNYNFNETHVGGEIHTTRGLRNVTIEYSTTGGSDTSEWTPLGDYEFEKAPDPVTDAYAGFDAANFGNAEARYVVITANDVNGNWGFNSGSNFVYALAEVLFFGTTPYASKPSPVDAGTGAKYGTSLGWTAGKLVADINGHQVYFGTSFADVNSADTSSAVYMGAQSSTGYVPDEIIDKTYYWRVDEVNGASTWRGDVWSFTGYAAVSWNPRPATETTGWGKWLTWSAGGAAADTNGHDIYVGTSFNDVYIADTSSSEYVGRQTDTRYCTGFLNDGNGLAHGETFYWRIDEVTAGGTAYTGEVWSFLNKRRIIQNGDGDYLWGTPLMTPTVTEARSYEEIMESFARPYEDVVQEMIDKTFSHIAEGDSQVDSFHWGEGGNTGVAEYNSVVLDRMGVVTEMENPFVTKMIESGDDLPIIMVEEAHRRGVEIFYAARLNDIHTRVKSRYLGKWYDENPDAMLLWDYTSHDYGSTTTLLFEQQKVRDFKADAIEELAQMYDFDGILIDFMRHLPHFTPGTELANAHYLTDFMTDVRNRLDVIGAARGRKVEIAIRVGDSIESDTRNGLDIATWVANGLVDQILPGQGSIDIKVEDYTAIAAGNDVQVYPCVYLNPSWYIPTISAEMGHALATNFWYQGGDGMSVFNWYTAWYPVLPPLFDEIGDPAILVGTDKMYTVERLGVTVGATAARWYPNLKLDANLPKRFDSGTTAFDFPIMVGEDIDGVYTPTDVTVEILTDAASINDLTIKLNSTVLTSKVAGTGTISVSSIDPTIVSAGLNAITIERVSGTSDVTGIHLYVDYDATPDFTAPTPSPMGFASAPAATGPASITMTANTATDTEAGVEYYFECTAGGGNDSGWQSSPVYTDAGLTPSAQYSYRVKARDTSVNNNETLFSGPASATTDAPNIADINADGQVNFIDFGIFALAYGSSTGEGNYNPACDLAATIGEIDGLDLKILMDNWLAGN